MIQSNALLRIINYFSNLRIQFISICICKNIRSQHRCVITIVAIISTIWQIIQLVITSCDLVPLTICIFLHSGQCKISIIFCYSFQNRKFLSGNLNPFPAFCIIIVLQFACFVIFMRCNDNFNIIVIYRSKIIFAFFVTEKLWFHIFDNVDFFSHLRIKYISICIRNTFRHDHIFINPNPNPLCSYCLSVYQNFYRNRNISRFTSGLNNNLCSI